MLTTIRGSTFTGSVSKRMIRRDHGCHALVSKQRIMRRQRTRRTLTLFNNMTVFAIRLAGTFPHETAIRQGMVRRHRSFHFFRGIGRHTPIVGVPRFGMRRVHILRTTVKGQQRLSAPNFHREHWHVMMILPRHRALLISAVHYFRLHPRMHDLRVKRRVTKTGVTPNVFVSLAARRLTTIDTLFASSLNSFSWHFVIGRHHTTFAAHHVIFNFVRTGTTGVAGNSRYAPFMDKCRTLDNVFCRGRVVLFHRHRGNIRFTNRAHMVSQRSGTHFINSHHFGRHFISIRNIQTGVRGGSFYTARRGNVNNKSGNMTQRSRFVTELSVRRRHHRLRQDNTKQHRWRFNTTGALLRPLLTTANGATVTARFTTARYQLRVIRFNSRRQQYIG